MSNASGKWRALETDNATSHVCKQMITQKGNQVSPRPVMEVKTPTENIQIIRFDIDTMELQKTMIAAIKELAYAINTQVISSLATNEEQRTRVLARIKEDM